MGKKQFERVFCHHVGMMPKEYARIVRFQKTLLMMQSGVTGYADIAFAAGYSDQSHFIREFKKFAGCTPERLTHPYSDLFSVPVWPVALPREEKVAMRHHNVFFVLSRFAARP